MGNKYSKLSHEIPKKKKNNLKMIYVSSYLESAQLSVHCVSFLLTWSAHHV